MHMLWPRCSKMAVLTVTGIRHGFTVAAAVLALHAAAAWALHGGLRARVQEVLVPVQMVAELLEPAAPVARAQQRPAMPARVSHRAAQVPTKMSNQALAAKPAPKAIRSLPDMMEPVQAPAVLEVAASVAIPTVGSPAGAAQPEIPARESAVESAAAASTRTAAAPAATPVRAMPLALELPSADAQYLNNPRLRYPLISHRLGEQGTVMIEVLVSDKGLAQEARIKTSSGFFRLDDAALTAVLSWRFVPGKRDGLAQSMWFTVPVTFGIQ